MTQGGVGALLVYFFLIAWVAKVAQRRGRIGLAWAGIAALAGAVAIVGGMVVIAYALDADASTGPLLLSILVPMIGMIVAMVGVAGILMKLPISTSTRRWTVHDMAPGSVGAGTVRIEGEHVRIEFPSGTDVVLLVALRRVEADGECIRLEWEDGGGAAVERTYLMGGTPDTADGRKQQSKVLAARLVSRPTPVAQLRT